MDSIPGASIVDVQVDSPTSRRVTFNTESAALAALEKCRQETLDNKPLSPSFYASKLTEYLFVDICCLIIIILPLNSIERPHFLRSNPLPPQSHLSCQIIPRPQLNRNPTFIHKFVSFPITVLPFLILLFSSPSNSSLYQCLGTSIPILTVMACSPCRCCLHTPMAPPPCSTLRCP